MGGEPLTAAANDAWPLTKADSVEGAGCWVKMGALAGLTVTATAGLSVGAGGITDQHGVTAGLRGR